MFIIKIVVKDKSNSRYISFVQWDAHRDNTYFLQACFKGNRVAWFLDCSFKHVQPTTKLGWLLVVWTFQVNQLPKILWSALSNNIIILTLIIV